jgi:hypothetical protein
MVFFQLINSGLVNLACNKNFHGSSYLKLISSADSHAWNVRQFALDRLVNIPAKSKEMYAARSK